MEIFIFIVAFVLFLAGGILFTYRHEKRKKELRAEQKKVLLSITVSQENELGPLAAEQMFAALHGIFRELRISEKFRGHEQDAFSFEIAAINQKIQL